MSGETPQPHLRIALLTDFTPAFLERELRRATRESGLTLDILTVDPNTRQAQLLDPESDLIRFNPDIVLSGLSAPVQWSRFQSRPPGPSRIRFGEELLEACLQDWDRIHAHLPHAEIWQANLGPFPDGISGTEASRDPTSFPFQREQFNHELKQALVPRRYVVLIDWAASIEMAGTGQAYDHRLWLTAAHPFSLDFLPALARPVVTRIHWRTGRFLKVLVLDLDNTLWGGVVGDCGPHAISIGQEGMGNVFRNFQLWLRHLKDEGILLAVASKNDPERAREAFTLNPENILKLEDFAAFQAGWDPKSEMIEAISRELNIGCDAFCFIDDSAFERNEVRSRLPGVTVPEMPEDPSAWIPFFARQGLFETGTHSTADSHRTQWIQEERQRRGRAESFANYTQYLQSLKMRARVVPLNGEHLARAHQLIMRTNQFNLRTVRYALEELEEMMDSPNWTGRVFGLRDTCGDSGWISLVLLDTRARSQGLAFLDTWVMSCRVFERGMEKAIFNRLVTELRESGFQRLEAEFIPTAKNGKFASLLDTLGFDPAGNNRWCLDLASAPVHETHITFEEAATDA
jgi:FkbH-like protein